MIRHTKTGMRIILFIFLALALFSFSSTTVEAISTGTTIYFNVNTELTISNIVTNPSFPFYNDGNEQNVSVNFTSSDYPINVTFKVYNDSNQLEFSQGPIEINSSLYLPLNLTINGDLTASSYSVNMTINNSASDYVTENLGTFTVGGSNPSVIVEHPWIGHYPYNINKNVVLVANITDSDGLNETSAQVTLPNSTKINLSLAKYVNYDDFSINTLNYYWFVQNQTIGDSQQCVVDIDKTRKGKAFTSILGEGSPKTDTYCGLRTSAAYYGDFDTNVSFNILHESGDSYALLAKISEEPDTHKPGKHIFISLGKWGNYGRTYDVFVSNGTISEYILEESPITEDTQGKLRLKRESNNFTFYVWNNTNNSWIELIEIELENMPHAMYFSLEVENAAPDWGRMDVEWDDPSIDVGDFYMGVFSNTTLLGEYNVTFFAKDNLGFINNSEETHFNITHINIIPSVPFLLKPQPDEILKGMYNILWSDVYDPNNDDVQFNISLLNTDYSFNRTIVSNYGNITTNNYWGNTSKVSDGEYSLEITVFENETEEKYSSYDFLWGNFTIDNTNPTIEFVYPTPISGTKINTNKIIVNVSVYDQNLDGIYFEVYNETSDLIYEDYSYDTYFESTNLTDGLYYFVASAHDLAGNYEYTEERNITIYQNNFIFTNHSLNPQLDLAYFNNYNYTVDVESYKNISNINLTYKTINAEDISCFQFYVNGSCMNDKPKTVNMSLLQEPTWYYTPIHPDDIYPQIAFSQDQIFWNNEPISENISNSNYHILKFKNNFAITKDSNIWIEFDAIVKNTSTNKLRVYLFDNTANLSTFNSSWLDSEKGELISTINVDEEKHHTHSENSSHYMIPLTAREDGIVGAKNLDINDEFWLVLFASSDDDSWKINYRDESLCNTTNWWVGSTNNWTTNQKTTGCPDAHIHLARYSVNKKSDCLDSFVCGIDILNTSYCSDNQTFCFENVLNLPPRPNQIISPEKYESYSCSININWSEFVDPNGDEVKYNIELLDSNYEFVRKIALNLESTNYQWDCYGDLEGVYVPDNKYTLSVEGVDDENASSKTYTGSYFIIDHTAPQINIISPNKEGYNNTKILLNLSVNDVSLDTITYNFNGTNFTYTNPINITFNEGINTIQVWANDSIQRTTYQNTTFIVDTIIPTLEIISPESKTYTDDEILLNINATDLNLDTITYNFNGTNFTYTNPINITFNEGNNQLKVWAKDIAENINSTTINFKKDTQPPECELISRTPDNITENSKGKFEVIIRCTDLSGINITKVNKSYQRAFVTYSLDSYIISQGPPNLFSIFYPENNIASYGHDLLPEPKYRVWRGGGRNINLVQWYEHLNYTNTINNDTYSYTINDGRLLGDLNIINITGNQSSPTEIQINYSGRIESSIFRTAYYLCQLSQTGEEKKEFNLTKENSVLLKMFDQEAYRDDNYIMYHHFNINSTEFGQEENIKFMYCNNSYNPDSSINIIDSPNCVYLTSLNRTDIHNKELIERNSSYIEISQQVDEGKTAGIETTPEFYLGIYLSNDVTNLSEGFKLRYMNGTNPTNVSFNETKTAWVSSTKGENWNQVPWTVDYFKTSVRFEDNEEFLFGLYVEDIYQHPYANFELITDQITPVYLAEISRPTILSYNSSLNQNDYQQNKTHSETMNIKIGMSIKRYYPGDPKHTLILTDSNGNHIYTIAENFLSNDDSNVWINFNTSLVPDGEYKTKVIAQSTLNPSNIEEYISTNTFTINNLLPTITKTKITDYAESNLSNVKLFISASNSNSVWAQIINPEGTSQNITLTNNQNTTFNNISKIGRYNVTFFAENIQGQRNKTDYFEIFPEIIFNFTVLDSNSTGVNSSWELLYRNTTILQNSSEIGNYSVLTPNLTADLRFKAYSNKLDVVLKGVKIIEENNKPFGMDKLQTPLQGYKVTYGINNKFNFSEAILKIYYDDIDFDIEDNLKLEKCNDWNFENQICNGSFIDITNSVTQNTAENYFEYTTNSFSGFSIKEDISTNIEQNLGGGTGSFGTCSPLWSCSNWSNCYAGIQTRSCTDTNCNNLYDDYVEKRNCSCVEQWTCEDWLECSENNSTTRLCKDQNNCGTDLTKPTTEKNCIFSSIPKNNYGFEEFEVRIRSDTKTDWLGIFIALLTFLVVRHIITRDTKNKKS